MFKIVETVENNRKELTIVPSNWENDRGTLSFPRKFASKLQREGDSVPEPNWITLSCKVKRKFLPSFETAEEELDQMVDADDTDRDDQIKMPPAAVPRKRPRVLLPKKTNNINNNTPDFNYLANSCIVNNRDFQSPLADVSAPETGEQNLQAYNVIYPSNQQTIQLVETIDPEVVSAEVTNIDRNKLDTIMKSLETVVENQHKIMKELSNFQVLFEIAMKKRNADNASTSSSLDSSRILHLQPIDCLEKLKELEDKLKDTEVFNQYVDRLSFICGKDTKIKGIDHSYMLVDKFFTRKFFTLCSWAGGAKVPNSKFAFKFFENVIRLFFKLVHLADQRFTLEDCEDFFKGVIRNCVRRNNSLNIRTSRSKKRPKHISYNAQVSENEVIAGNASIPNSHEGYLTNDDEVMEPFNEDNDEQE